MSRDGDAGVGRCARCSWPGGHSAPCSLPPWPHRRVPSNRRLLQSTVTGETPRRGRGSGQISSLGGLAAWRLGGSPLLSFVDDRARCSPRGSELSMRARSVTGGLLGAPDADGPREAEPHLGGGLVADARLAETDVEVEPFARAPDAADETRPRRDAGYPLVLDEDLAHGAKRVFERPFEDE